MACPYRRRRIRVADAVLRDPRSPGGRLVAPSRAVPGEISRIILQRNMPARKPLAARRSRDMGFTLRGCDVTRRAACNDVFDMAARTDLHQFSGWPSGAKWRSASVPPSMNHFENLVAAWQCCDEAAFQAECRVERALDEYCSARGSAPSPADVASIKRLRFIANHRLRWLLYQTHRAQAQAALI